MQEVLGSVMMMFDPYEGRSCLLGIGLAWSFLLGPWEG